MTKEIRKFNLRSLIPYYTLDKCNDLEHFLGTIFLFTGLDIEGELKPDGLIHQMSTSNYKTKNSKLVIQLKKEIVYPLTGSQNPKPICEGIVLQSSEKREIYHFLKRVRIEADYNFL